MPEVVVRKRLGRRSGDWKYHVNRWYYRNRPMIAVTAAFTVAVVLALAAASMGLQNLGGAAAQAEPPAAASP